MATLRGFANKDTVQLGRRKVLVEKIASVLDKVGYSEGGISLLYPMKESFPKSDFDDRMKLVDSDGSILCVLDDTVVGLLHSTENTLCRVYGVSEQYKLFGEVRNEACFAAILVGISGADGEAEVITTGMRILEKLGIPFGRLVLGNTSVISGVADNLLNRKVSKSEIKGIIEGKFNSEEECSAAKFIMEVAQAKGGLSVIGSLAEKISNKTSIDGLVLLFELSKVLEEYGVEKIEFDLSRVGNDYDNGIIFSIYDDKGNLIIDGGRHDHMCSDGIKRAVSLRLYPDYILSLYPDLVEYKGKYDVVVGAADSIKATRCAYRLKNGFADSELRTLVLYKVQKEELTALAGALGIESAVFVDAEGNITHE